MKTRRDFIKISAAGGGAAALGLGALNWKGATSLLAADETGPVSDEEMTPYPTYCEVCFWKCAGWTYVDKKGKIKKIIGNKDDPAAPAPAARRQTQARRDATYRRCR